jgi:uncharacterized membrane protein
LALVYGVLCLASLAVALFFTAHGAWYVLGFAILELAAVGVAFVQCGRHASDRERIALRDDCLLVEVVRAEQTQQFRLDPQRIHVESPGPYRGLIGLEAGSTRIEIGRFLTQWKRCEFASELRDVLVPVGRKEF